MFCKTYSAVLLGMEAVTVQVEADVRNGLPQLQMVGALASEAKEARERVRVAIENAGFRLAPKHITVNLSPADIRKEGTSFDLATAVSILAAFGIIPEEQTVGCMFAGELSLDGKLNKVPGILPMAGLAAREGFRKMLVPKGNAGEAALQGEVPVYGMESLMDVVDFLTERRKQEPEQPLNPEILKKHQKEQERGARQDLGDIIGQAAAKRALVIAAAGGHHLLMIGPPGSGKTALANCMPSLLPEISFDEMLELSTIYSVAGQLKNEMQYVKERPFQAPHHAATQAALLGGGRTAKPGL
ncbi:MAG: ATP-binding protein, partial [Lachnospiraceae bacterium]|nr:ATP-binding protein [Lachnospiraceae bacterium]